MKDSQVIYDFVSLAIESGGWMRIDRAYLQNKLADMIGAESSFDIKNQISNLTSEELCQKLIAIAKNNKPSIYKTNEDIDRLAQSIMDILTPPPSVVNAMFAKKFESSPLEATNYLYWVNQVNGYLSGGEEISSGVEFDDPMKGLCPLCFENEGAYQYNSPFLKKTRRFIRLNLNNESWGYQLSPLEKNKEVGVFFPEDHTTVFMNSNLVEKMVQLVDLYTHYELHYSQDSYFNGHSYLVGKRVKRDKEIDCNLILPFFKDSKLAYNEKGENELVIRSPKGQDIWLVMNYVFSLTVTHKRGLYKHHFDYFLLKKDKEYQFTISLRKGVHPTVREDWLYTMELLSNELEVRY